jgi:hypothetical protein
MGSLMPMQIKIALHLSASGRLTHVVVHTVAFALLSFLLARTVNSVCWSLAVLAATTSFGIALEILESFVFSYPYLLESSDMRLDAYGAMIGCVVATFPRLRKQR